MASQEIHLPSLEYFKFYNGYTGSIGAYNYRIVPEESALKTAVWHSCLCFEKCEIVDTAEFSLDQEGVEQLKEWLTQQYLKFLSVG